MKDGEESSLPFGLTLVLLVFVLLALLSFFLGSPVTPPPAGSTPSPNALARVFVTTKLLLDGTSQETVALSINKVGIGQVQLLYPSKMNIGDSGLVKLTITPDLVITAKLKAYTPGKNDPSTPPPIQIDEHIDIYPIMRAQFLGSGFEVETTEDTLKAILSDRSTDWTWSVRPKEVGTQTISVQIDIPAIVDGNTQVVGTIVKDISGQIKVRKTIAQHIRDLPPLVIPALIGLLGAIIAARLNDKRKTAVT